MKILTLSTLLVLSLFLTGCNKAEPNSTDIPAEVSETQTEAQLQTEAQKISNAMQSGEKLQCTIVQEETNERITYLVQGKNFKISGLTENMEEGQTGFVVSDGVSFYSWLEPKNEGVKMTIPSEEELDAQMEKLQMDIPELDSEEAVERYEDDGYRITCDPASFDNSEFIPPLTVKFQDVDAMMQQGLDSALEGMSEADKAEMERLLQEYGQ